MKGRCIGVSLYSIYARFLKKYKVIKSLPESVTAMGTPQYTCPKGSFTVEAAVILPLVACFFSFLLFFFQVMQVQLSVQNALEKTGRNLALLAAVELDEQTEDTREIAYFSLAKASVYMELKEDEKIEQYISGGVLGVSLLASETEGDFITLEANYGMKFPVDLLGKKYFWIKQKASFRKWTGWRAINGNNAEDILVYITQYGEVYHQRKSCPYLSLSIQKVKLNQIWRLRNKSGGIYRACETCEGEKTRDRIVYVTDYGERYHYEVDCSGLKRTIYQKKLSEVEEKNPCPKCWK